MKTTNQENYESVVAIAERSNGNDQVGDMWLETKSFDKITPICEILDWADHIHCSGKLIITIDESTRTQTI